MKDLNWLNLPNVQRVWLVNTLVINRLEFKDAMVNFYQVVFQRSLNMSAPIAVEIDLKDQVHS